ncbi:hypothetical protein ACLMJK_003187 [Lecanora helva]
MATSVLDMSQMIGPEPTTSAQRQAAREAKQTGPKICAKCNKSEDELQKPLKHCAKCHHQTYCSRECQTADWKAHKKSCASTNQAKPKATTDFSAWPKPAGDFMTGLVTDSYLHQFSEKDTYTQLIDCYRMRLEDDYKFACDNRGIYGGMDPLSDFEEFLDYAEKRKGILPKWWNPDKRLACERLAVDATQWSDINCAVEKHDVQEHYKDQIMPMKLRLLAEKIYGKKIEMGYIGGIQGHAE